MCLVVYKHRWNIINIYIYIYKIEFYSRIIYVYMCVKFPPRDLNPVPCPPLPHILQALIFIEWQSRQGCTVVLLYHLLSCRDFKKYEVDISSLFY